LGSKGSRIYIKMIIARRFMKESFMRGGMAKGFGGLILRRWVALPWVDLVPISGGARTFVKPGRV
jgi:hypothetical protein